MTNLHFLDLVQYHAKRFKIEWVLFDILRGIIINHGRWLYHDLA